MENTVIKVYHDAVHVWMQTMENAVIKVHSDAVQACAFNMENTVTKYTMMLSMSERRTWKILL